MTESECLAKMVAPGTRRPGKYREGVIQIHVTRACNLSCFNCTQGSNLGGRTGFISLENFEAAVKSLVGYFGVVGVFGGNPAMHPEFPALCEILRRHIPFEQRGLWCNDPINAEKGYAAARTFNPAVSNLNVHLSQEAFGRFKTFWPAARPFGLHEDSRHSPCYVAMRDVIEDEGRRYDFISNCDINQHWSAMVCEFRGQPRAFFCEIAGAQAMLHQDEPDYPDTGLDPTKTFFLETGTGADSCLNRYSFDYKWWQLNMASFAAQVRKHCHECGVPLRGYGELAQSSSGKEQVSKTHEGIYRLKRSTRQLEVVTDLIQLGSPLVKVTDYLGNSKR